MKKFVMHDAMPSKERLRQFKPNRTRFKSAIRSLVNKFNQSGRHIKAARFCRKQ